MAAAGPVGAARPVFAVAAVLLASLLASFDTRILSYFLLGPAIHNRERRSSASDLVLRLCPGFSSRRSGTRRRARCDLCPHARANPLKLSCPARHASGASKPECPEIPWRDVLDQSRRCRRRRQRKSGRDCRSHCPTRSECSRLCRRLHPDILGQHCRASAHSNRNARAFRPLGKVAVESSCDGDGSSPVPLSGGLGAYNPSSMQTITPHNYRRLLKRAF